MSVLVDTTVWSLGIRRAPDSLNPDERRVVGEWERLVSRGEAALIGPIRQEVLSGIRDRSHFDTLRVRLESFPDLEIARADWVEAARSFNTLRRHGVTAAPVDLMVCAVALNHGAAIFTADQDFIMIARHLPITLHRIPKA